MSGTLQPRIDQARSRLAALADAWHRAYPMLWDPDAAPPEVVKIRTSAAPRLPHNPDHPPQLHKAYVDAAKHTVRCGLRVSDLVDAPIWYSTLVDDARPLPPHPDVARAGTLVVREALGRVAVDDIDAVAAQVAESACDEADAAYRMLERMGRELVHPKQRRCVEPGCGSPRDGRHRRCKPCRAQSYAA